MSLEKEPISITASLIKNGEGSYDPSYYYFHFNSLPFICSLLSCAIGSHQDFQYLWLDYAIGNIHDYERLNNVVDIEIENDLLFFSLIDDKSLMEIAYKYKSINSYIKNIGGLKNAIQQDSD